MVTIWREKDNIRPPIAILLFLVWVSVQTFSRKNRLLLHALEYYA